MKAQEVRDDIFIAMKNILDIVDTLKAKIHSRVSEDSIETWDTLIHSTRAMQDIATLTCKQITRTE